MSAEALSESLVSPPLKWAGGKRWLIPHLLPLWTAEKQRRYVEPFVGGLALPLGLQPETAVLNDLNVHVVNFYRWLQRGLTPAPRKVAFKNDQVTFSRNRKRFNELIATGKETSMEAALLFYYLNRTCFNGLCRFNSKGYFNVPFGRYKTIAYRPSFLEYRAALAEYDFRAGDFEDIRLRKSDFVYADPPYDVVFTSYSAGGFGWDDQVRLAKWLAGHKGPVVASNQATPRILALYRELGFRVKTLPAPRRISCDGNRDDALEMLATRGL